MEQLYKLSPYELDKDMKRNLIVPKYCELTKLHYENCEAYRRILDAFYGKDFKPSVCGDFSEIPFLPVRLFKEFDLLSVQIEDVTRTVKSSGTTGQVSSKIFLDKYTAKWQQKVLTRIVSDFIGKSRMPMLVVDTEDVIKDRTMFSTRGSGILGFSTFGTSRMFALNSDMSLNTDVLEKFFEENSGKRVLLFGFTFIIWKHFLLELENLALKGKIYDLSNAVMVHGGGWKKLKSEAVSKDEFKGRFKKACGMTDIYENYGMAEQTGSIFVECECGHLHTSIFSEVIIRNPRLMKPCGIGEKGIMQVMSLIPHSYPGHSLLTEDEAIILGEDDCPCGRKGKYFEIKGRIRNAELRGCSDTYAAGIKR